MTCFVQIYLPSKLENRNAFKNKFEDVQINEAKVTIKYILILAFLT